MNILNKDFLRFESRLWVVTLLFLSLLTVTGLSSCGGHRGHSHEHEEHEHHDDDHDDEHDGEHHEHHHDAIILSVEKAKAAGVVAEVVNPGMFHYVIHTSGKVMSASCDETTVVATISGRIGPIGHVSEGMAIGKAAKLFTITSADMQVADGDPVKRAKIAFEKAEKDYKRGEILVKDKIISEKDFAGISTEYERARLTYRSMLASRSAGGIVVSAPCSGFIKQCLVNEGDYVEAGQPLAVLTQNKHLYLRAEVPASHFKKLRQIKCAKFKTTYSDTLYDITDMGGHIQSYGRFIEDQKAYVPVIFEFNNTGDVVQGSYAEIYLIADDRPNVIAVPLTAITEEQGIHYIYIKHDDDEYLKREVVLGESDGNRVEITSGLKGGECVVTKGAVQVKLASASNAIPAHTHNH